MSIENNPVDAQIPIYRITLQTRCGCEGQIAWCGHPPYEIKRPLKTDLTLALDVLRDEVRRFRLSHQIEKNHYLYVEISDGVLPAKPQPEPKREGLSADCKLPPTAMIAILMEGREHPCDRCNIDRKACRGYPRLAAAETEKGNK